MNLFLKVKFLKYLYRKSKLNQIIADYKLKIQCSLTTCDKIVTFNIFTIDIILMTDSTDVRYKTIFLLLYIMNYRLFAQYPLLAISFRKLFCLHQTKHITTLG